MRTISISLPEEMADYLKELADFKSTSMSEIVRTHIEMAKEFSHKQSIIINKIDHVIKLIGSRKDE